MKWLLGAIGLAAFYQFLWWLSNSGYDWRRNALYEEARRNRIRILNQRGDEG